ncbi:MAG TPA: hypothetical protein DCR87_08040 [Acidobacteria bacterium]|nr:hypothetical protein [Acidobacteriota bacterium]
MNGNTPHRALKIDRPGVKPQNRGGGFLAGRASKTASSFNLIPGFRNRSGKFWLLQLYVSGLLGVRWNRAAD